MTHGVETAEDGGQVEAQESFDLSLLWLWPVLLLHALFQTFAAYAVQLKAMRKGGLPGNWEQAIPGLLESEWHIRAITASGAAMLLSGKAFSLEEVEMDWDPPADLQLPRPRSDWESHRRFEAIARFHADPQTFVRRQARRIVRAEAMRLFGLDPATTILPVHAIEATTIFDSSLGFDNVHPELQIRAPPKRTLIHAQSVRNQPARAPRGNDSACRKDVYNVLDMFFRACYAVFALGLKSGVGDGT